MDTWDRQDTEPEQEEKERQEKTTAGQQIPKITTIYRPKPSDSLGISGTFDRAKYDDPAKRKAFKEADFAGRKTMQDRYTGKTLHKDTNAAKRKYGQKAYTGHSADIDHVKPIKEIYEQNKYNSFLSDENLKEIANIKSNYRTISAQTNRQKRDSPNLEFALDFSKDISSEQRAKMIADGIQASVAVSVKTVELTAHNAANTFVDGGIRGLENNAIPLVINGVQNMALVAQGEKDIGEAVLDTGLTAGKVVLMSGGRDVGGQAMVGAKKALLDNPLAKGAAAKLNNALGAKVAGQIAQSAGQIAQAVMLVKDSALAYLDGKIDEIEFAVQLAQNGAQQIITYVIGTAANAVAPIIGPIIVSLVTSAAFSIINRTIADWKWDKQMMKQDRRRLKNIDAFAKQVEAEIEHQNELLKQQIDMEYAEWDRIFQRSLQGIAQAALRGDVDAMTCSLGDILEVFGAEVRFKSHNEFKDAFMDPNFTFAL